MNQRCELCERENLMLTKHHALPKEEGGTMDDVIMICSNCHRHIHALYTNKELAVRLSTLQALKSDEQLSRFIKFIRKQPSQKKIRIKKSNERRKS